jgi:hypothetical protein
MKSTIGASLQVQEWDFGSTLLKLRFAEALEQGSSRYPIYRSVNFAARRPLDELFDMLAVQLGWHAHRLDTSSLILESEGLFATARGNRKNDYSSCHFGIWADSIDRVRVASDAVLALVGDSRITEPMFTIDWHFLTGRGELENAPIEELANDRVYDEAYPYLAGGLRSFVDRYLSSAETVLVLQGNPGTGKTRLIRAILGEIARREDGHASALYTGDKKTMESDEIFVKFITGWHDAFVVEDADHLLRPRAEGNENLHRFLSIADGVVRSQGRKIIFSTNLPNVGDLDDALVRPGRCFAHVLTRALDSNETERLVAALTKTSSQPDNTRVGLDAKPHTLAEIYRAVADRAR